MNKAELVEALAQHYDGSKVDAGRALSVLVHTISSATAAGERVAITGFGVFERVERPARTVRNPRTGERLDVPATAVPRFRAGTELKAYAAGTRPVPELGPAPTVRRSVAPAAPVPAAPSAAAPEATPSPVAKIKSGTSKIKSSTSKIKSGSTKTSNGAKKKDVPAKDVKKKDVQKNKGRSKAVKKGKGKKG